MYQAWYNFYVGQRSATTKGEMTMNTRTLTLYAEESGVRMMRLDQDEIGFHVYYFECGECLSADTFEDELEARTFMKHTIATW